MSRTSVLTTALAIVFGAGLAAQKTPDFSGTWVLDASRSEMPQGRGPMGDMGGRLRDMTVAIKQTAETLIVEQRMGDRSRTLTYRLDGSESTNTGLRGAEAKSTSKWQGNSLVTDTTQIMEGLGRSATITSHEIRSMSPDGTMVVETVRETPRGKMKSKLVFRKTT